MTELQIIHKAVSKAIAQGWDGKGYMFNAINPDSHSYYTTLGYPLEQAKKLLVNHKEAEFEIETHDLDIYRLIFNHNFARALFGKEYVDDYGLTKEERESGKSGIPIGAWGFMDYAWGFHLKQMVLDEQPLRYLERFIEKESL